VGGGASADGGDEGKRTGLAIAATLIGSGGTGMSAGQSARSIVQGVLDGNEVITASDGSPAWPVIEHLRIVEVYLDRASEAWRTLKMDDQAVPGRIALSEIIEAHVGGLTGEDRLTQARLTSSLEWGYRGADYDFISALAQQTSGGEPEIAYTLNTKRARTEVRAQKTQGRLLKELVLHAANARNTDERIGRTLFGLLVPIEMEPFLAGSAALQLELDDNTAGFPWELLDNNDPSAYFDEAGRRRVTNSTRPWAIRSKLLRKLRTVEFRTSVTDATPEASILVIGEPECPTEYPRLPAARREAHAVCECFSTTGKMPPENIRPLISPEDGVGANALTIMNALRERDWRIVHIAGHGALPSPTNGNGGIVLTNGTFLSATEIRTFRTVPELVFINCCHLGARNIDQLLYDRGKFAAGVAEELIKIGVRCVIAAGWAVDDVAASRFAVTFYRCLLDGACFIDAVAEARAAAFEEGGNTWAAYQCYGDPDWTFTGNGAAQAIDNGGDEFAFIATPSALLLALNAIAVETKYRGRKQNEQRDKVKALEARFAEVWSANGALAEGFAIAYAGVGETDKAIEWYDRALAANDGTAPIRSAEQVSNLRIRRAWRAVMQARQDKKKKRTALSDARKAITKAMSTLDATITLQPTVERLSLYGSAYKRLALLEAEAGRRKEEKLAIEQMTEQYRLAAELGEQSHSPDYFYPAMNYLVGDLVLNAGDAKWKGPAPGFIERVRKSLEARCNTDLDFWSMVGLIELTVYEAVAARRLAAALPGVVEQYEALNGRIDSKWMWGSVHDTAAFALNRYRARVKSKAEQKAVDDLLERLSQLAGG
jgi:tetratricopeptide (TPR) repeat protein